MNNVTVQLHLWATDRFQGSGEAIRTYRAIYCIERGPGFVGGSGVAVLSAKPDSPLSLVFEAEGPTQRTAIMVSGDERQQIGTVIVADPDNHGDVFVEFENAMSRAFFNATCAVVAVVESVTAAVPQSAVAMASAAQPAPVVVQPAVVVANVDGGTVRVKRGMRHLFVKRNVIGFGLFVGAAMTVYGMTVGKPPQNPIKATMQGENYEDLQAQIRAQIAAAAKSDVPMIDGKNDGLGGQNVAIETMKAMGLDPGKANAGCLVGVK